MAPPDLEKSISFDIYLEQLRACDAAGKLAITPGDLKNQMAGMTVAELDKLTDSPAYTAVSYALHH